MCSKVIEERLIMTSHGGLRYVAELKNGRPEHKMDHLACFVGNCVMLIIMAAIKMSCRVTFNLFPLLSV